MHVMRGKILTMALTVIVLVGNAGSGWAGSNDLESRAWKLAALTTIGLTYLTNPAEADTMYGEMGAHGDDVFIEVIGARWDTRSDLLKIGHATLNSYWQVEYTKWQSLIDRTQEGANSGLGAAYVYRFLSDSEQGLKPFLDVGLGGGFISSTHINERQFGTNFQFNSLYRLGMAYGERRQWEASYRFMHYSNFSIATPNKGINFHLLSLNYRY